MLAPKWSNGCNFQVSTRTLWSHVLEKVGGAALHGQHGWKSWYKVASYNCLTTSINKNASESTTADSV